MSFQILLASFPTELQFLSQKSKTHYSNNSLKPIKYIFPAPHNKKTTIAAAKIAKCKQKKNRKILWTPFEHEACPGMVDIHIVTPVEKTDIPSLSSMTVKLLTFTKLPRFSLIYSFFNLDITK